MVDLARARLAIAKIMNERDLARGVAHPFDAIMAESEAALGVTRSGLWTVARDRSLSCSRLRIDGHFVDSSLALTSAEAYVHALENLDVVAIENIEDDPRAVELRAYARQHQIGAMIDVPLWLDGRLHTVICHEHVGGPRRWSDAERSFVVTVGAMLSLALETERRVRAELLRAGAEARYRHLVESLPCVVYAFDYQTARLVYVSPNATQLGGWTAEQWLRHGSAEEWIRRVDEADRRAVRARFQVDVATATPELEYRIALPDGRLAWVRDACLVVRDPLGRPIAVQGTLTDISNARLAADAVREHRRRFEELFDNIELFGVIVDANGRIVHVNNACAAALGRSGEQLIGVSWRDVALPPDARDRVDVDAKRHLDRMVCANGEIRLVDWTDVVLRDLEGTRVGTASLGVDVTARAEVEAAVLRDMRFDTLGRISALVAHDLANLVAVLQAAVDDLEDEVAPPPELVTPLRQVSKRAHGMLKLVRRAQAGEGGVVETAARNLIQAADAIWAVMARGRATLEVELDAGADAMIAVDVDAVTQLLTNLVGNALDATPTTGSVRVRLTTEPSEHGVCAVFSVIDSGSGMSREVVHRAFEPFFTTKAHGSGLGLANARAIASRFGGTLEIESNPGAGTTIRLKLPTRSSQDLRSLG